MTNFFSTIKETIETTIKRELEDISYMEVITAVSDNVEGHIRSDAWDILDALRNPEPSKADPGMESMEKSGEVEMLKADIVARTRIELDGDILFLMKGENGQAAKMSEDLMALHKLGVKTSIENWHYFLDFVIKMTATIGVILGDFKPENAPWLKTS